MFTVRLVVPLSFIRNTSASTRLPMMRTNSTAMMYRISQLSHMAYFRLRPIVVLAALAGVVATLLFGNWQRHKADYRTVLQERIVQALNDAPLALANHLGD